MAAPAQAPPQSLALAESSRGFHGQSDEEEIDTILEHELAVSLQRQALLPPPPSNGPPVSTRASTLLTFAFPGWGVDIFRDPKCRRPSIVRHEQLENGLASDGKESQVELSLEVRWKKKNGPWGAAESPGDGSTVHKLPDELLANVLQRLGIRDLCSSIQTCQWWQRVGSRDEIWETFCQCLSDDVAASSLPKWAMIKNGLLADQVKRKNTSRYACSWKGFDHLRRALRSWWENGRPDNLYSSRILHFLLQKMTAVDWCLVYEFLGVMFTERADYLANILMEELSRRNQHNAGHFCCDQISVSKELGSKLVNTDTVYKVPMNSDSCSAEKFNCKIQTGLIGIEMWKHVVALWSQYKQWLKLVFTHCPELNYEVMLERNRSKTRSTTPTVYDKGVTCFRGQVLLKYGLRKMLQSGFSWLEIQVANGTASEPESEQLHSIYHLLQEVDVLDDSMLSQRNFTQSKLRRCFPVKRSYHRVE
eukprot:c26836_g1_i1 orf=613-2043(-)